MKNIVSKSFFTISSPLLFIGGVGLLGFGLLGSKKVLKTCNKFKLWVMTEKKDSYFCKLEEDKVTILS